MLADSLLSRDRSKSGQIKKMILSAKAGVYTYICLLTSCKGQYKIIFCERGDFNQDMRMNVFVCGSA